MRVCLVWFFLMTREGEIGMKSSAPGDSRRAGDFLYPLYIKAWAVEGSNDNRAWTQLDSQNTNDHTSRSIIRTYSIQNAPTIPFFKHIRLRRTDKSANNSHSLALSGFTIFGRIKLKPSKQVNSR
jgi:hypothetical protein